MINTMINVIQPPDLISRAPSRWHAERRRERLSSPRHDEMQIEFLAWLRGRPITGLSDTALVHRHVESEYPLMRRSEIVGWADAIEILDVGLTCIVSLFEIKPSIDTPFGILRQAKSYLQLAQAAFARADHITMHIIVPASDPLLPQLRAEWPQTWGWGATFKKGEIDG